jgi:precorrin-6x reductase
MTVLIRQERPALVLDATHPYAAEVSANIRAACTEAGVSLVRILRDEGEVKKDCLSFSTHGDLIALLEKTPGVIFVATGAKEAAIFTGLSGFQERVWFRMLPDIGGLKNCLDLGYSAARIICMQGPFSRDLNRAMFAAAAASILVTKNSGALGGFAEKLEAARDLGMRVALLARPPDPGGVPLEKAIAELEGLGS